MSIDLINSVVNGDYVSANRLFEERLANIQEKKLYELKRMIQAEAFGGMTKAEIEAKKKAGYRKAADVLYDPRSKESLSDAAKKYRASLKKKKVSEDVNRLTAPDAPRTLDIGDRYERALKQAQDLESRGSSGKISRVKKLYRPYRAARAIGSAIGGTGKIAAGVASDIASKVALEE